MNQGTPDVREMCLVAHLFKVGVREMYERILKIEVRVEMVSHKAPFKQPSINLRTVHGTFYFFFLKG